MYEPTLTGLKPASLFRYQADDRIESVQAAVHWARELEPYGITVGEAVELSSAAPYTAGAGSSQWKVISEFCRVYGGFLPRFSKTGELLAAPEQAGRQLVLDESSPIRSCRLREDHYGVITEALVIDKRQNISYSVRNPEMIRKGGQCRRVVYTPGKSTWAAMRYTGEYQIQQSRQDEKTVTVSLPGSFGAFPGDRAELRLSKLGLEGFFRVAEAENRFSAREGAVMTHRHQEDEDFWNNRIRKLFGSGIFLKHGKRYGGRGGSGCFHHRRGRNGRCDPG